MGIAAQIDQPSIRENTSVMTAPKVTISAWAKFEMPVVPKTRERPIAASASMSPKFSPVMRRWTSWSTKLVTLRTPSPMKKLTVTRPPGPTSASFTFGVSSSGSTTAMPVGQGRLVEGDRVRPRSSRARRPPTALGLVGGDLGVDAVAADGQHDSLERLAVELDVAADAEGELVRVDLVGGGRARGERGEGEHRREHCHQQGDRARQPRLRPPVGNASRDLQESSGRRARTRRTSASTLPGPMLPPCFDGDAPCRQG